jgi:hypothetical protein
MATRSEESSKFPLTLESHGRSSEGLADVYGRLHQEKDGWSQCKYSSGVKVQWRIKLNATAVKLVVAVVRAVYSRRSSMNCHELHYIVRLLMST